MLPALVLMLKLSMISQSIGNYSQGRAAYYMAAFIKFLTYKDKEITLNIDGNKIQSKILLVAIANGNYYGGGMKVNPNGMLDDGYFNVIVIDSVPRYKFPFHIFKFIKGDYFNIFPM